jgi:crotonobetainyl-CoA:carnitine CoA-transferase CaiB-like acyl-CoA transferase
VTEDADAPLAGVLVVALEQAVAAPLCSCRLADAGARVVKLERPDGDFARAYDRAARGGSSYFVWLNRGKESAVVDLRRDEDLAFVRATIARADVFLENLAPGAAARLGLGADALRAAHPALVTCSIAGYDAAGPYRERKAYDLLVQAESGLASITGTPDGPGRVGVSVVDIATGLNAYAGILAALYARQRNGRGRHVAVSLFGAIAEWMTVPLLHHDYAGRAPARVGLNHPSIAPYGVYTCGDGTAVLISIQNAREWASLVRRVLERPALLADPRYADNDARVANRASLDAIIAECLAPLSGAAFCERLDHAAIAYGRLHDVAGLSGHPHLRRVTIDTEDGEIAVPAPPLGLTPPVRRAVPRLGEHDAALRREFAAPRGEGRAPIG